MLKIIKREIEDLKLLSEIIVSGKLLKVIVKSFKQFKPALKQNKLFFLIILLAFFSGWFLSAQYYSIKCSNILVEKMEEYKEYLNSNPVFLLQTSDTVKYDNQNNYTNNDYDWIFDIPGD